ncbi:MAG: hypothetical protein PHO01_12965 [Desulfotomaculaceae bacterium]|nr:hypothetical protein [Desulfotomaculaceae bacterium]
MISILSELQEKIQTQSTIACFIKRFNIVRLLIECGFTKIKGFTIASIIEFLFALVFTHKKLNQTMNTANNDIPFAKDTVYRKLGAEIINNHLSPLTSENRIHAIVFDDSPYYRDRSKKVELLALIKDHVTGRYFKGFRKFTAGWTDGATFIPLATTLLSAEVKGLPLFNSLQPVFPQMRSGV